MLSSTPPTCKDIGVFKCTGLIDGYDIYNYVTLHVPMGSKETYSSAYEWRYFKKIKEDMEQNGNVYYAPLRVKQGDVGYSEQIIKADETYTICLGASGNNTINTVTFNGKDVTEQVYNGYYTTPEIKGPSVLSVTYENNGANNVAPYIQSDVRVFGHDGCLSVTNIDKPTSVNVYTVDGKLVSENENCIGSLHVNIADNERYIVKVGERTFKVAL